MEKACLVQFEHYSTKVTPVLFWFHNWCRFSPPVMELLNFRPCLQLRQERNLCRTRRKGNANPVGAAASSAIGGAVCGPARSLGRSLGLVWGVLLQTSHPGGVKLARKSSKGRRNPSATRRRSKIGPATRPMGVAGRPRAVASRPEAVAGRPQGVATRPRAVAKRVSPVARPTAQFAGLTSPVVSANNSRVPSR